MDKIYKLLRNNRQTGPYTLAELVALDLKPFDLIWADGKTAGWMYPSEIEALKPYLAEEKPEPVKAAEAAPAVDTTSTLAEPAQATATVAEKQATVPSSAKHIFISMPAGGTQAKATPVAAASTPQAEGTGEEETPAQKLERKAMELRQRVQALAEAKKGESEEPSLDTKYARSLDDIKEEYTHWMHEQKHKGRAIKISKKQWMQAALVLVVASAGYGVFSWLSAPKETQLAVDPTPVAAPITATHTATPKEREEPAQSVINTDYSERNAGLLEELDRANKRIEEDLKRYPGSEQKTTAPPIADADLDAGIPDTYDPYEEDTPPETYETKKPEPASTSNPPVRTVSYRTTNKTQPLSQQIDVSAKYLRASRGKGLEGVELRLRNNSTQVLKTVAIDVFYYQDGDRLLDKETVYFNDIAPGEGFTVTAPGNKRASSATYQLGLISSDGGLYVAKQ